MTDKIVVRAQPGSPPGYVPQEITARAYTRPASLGFLRLDRPGTGDGFAVGTLKAVPSGLFEGDREIWQVPAPCWVHDDQRGFWALVDDSDREWGAISDLVIERAVSREAVARECFRQFGSLPPPLADPPVCVWDVNDKRSPLWRDWDAAMTWAEQYVANRDSVFRIEWMTGGWAIVHRYHEKAPGVRYKTALADVAITTDRIELPLPPEGLR